MQIRTEQTPNPATRKFLPGQTVMEAGTRDFADAESAEASPLASALFASGLVEGVFYGSDFISVTAQPGVSWTDLEPVVIETLLDHFLGGLLGDPDGAPWDGIIVTAAAPMVPPMERNSVAPEVATPSCS